MPEKLMRDNLRGAGAFSRVADHLNRLAGAVNSVQGENGIEAGIRNGRLWIRGPGSTQTTQAPFDLYDRTTTTAKLRACWPLNDTGDHNYYPRIFVGNNWQEIAPGAGGQPWVLDLTLGVITHMELTFTAATFIYINVAISGADTTTYALTLETAASYPESPNVGDISAGSAAFPIMLWYVPWSTDHVDWANLWNLRDLPHHPSWGN
jgi:hypothetical protein